MENCCGQEEQKIQTLALEQEIQSEEDQAEAELEFYSNKDLKASERLEICKTCPELKELNMCSQCGCFMNIKTRIFFSKCPLGKW